MGSGNVLAKQFGVPRDPVAGMRGLLKNLETGRTVPCCVMRCEVWKSSEDSETHYATTLAGLGQFGRIPGDLARWHLRMPILHKGAARLLGIERLTCVSYSRGTLFLTTAASGWKKISAWRFGRQIGIAFNFFSTKIPSLLMAV